MADNGNPSITAYKASEPKKFFCERVLITTDWFKIGVAIPTIQARKQSCSNLK